MNIDAVATRLDDDVDEVAAIISQCRRLLRTAKPGDSMGRRRDLVRSRGRVLRAALTIEGDRYRWGSIHRTGSPIRRLVSGAQGHLSGADFREPNVGDGSVWSVRRMRNRSSAGRWLAWRDRPFALRVQRSPAGRAEQGPVSDVADIRRTNANVSDQSDPVVRPVRSTVSIWPG